MAPTIRWSCNLFLPQICGWHLLPIQQRKGCFGIFQYINDKHPPNIRFTMETEVIHKLPFLDVLLDNSNPPSLVTSVFRKSTYTGLLTNFFSFTPFPYKLGLIRTLVDRTFKINNTWIAFTTTSRNLPTFWERISFHPVLLTKLSNIILAISLPPLRALSQQPALM